MKLISQIASLVGLTAVMLPCLLFYGGLLELSAVKWLGLVGTLVWFVATPLWMGRELPIDAAQVEI